MRSAFLLSKDTTLFDSFASYLRTLGYECIGHEPESRSICVNPNGEFQFMFYDRPKDPDSFERHEIPDTARHEGYVYGYMIECRSELLFCRIVRSTPPEIDLLVCDSDGNLFKPSELDPESLVL